MQSADKRKNLRRSISYPAFIDLGDGSPRVCSLCDASQEGAQLAVADPDALPDEFILALSADGAARRRCRIVWRTQTQIGVVFLKESHKTAARKPAMQVCPSQQAAAAAKPPEAVPHKVDVETLTSR
jgi:hypothetical protein